jgi:putative glutathione S-transferase
LGLLVKGKWHDRGYDTESNGGRFKRQKSSFRNWVTDADKNDNADQEFVAEADRYHLYVSFACPWAHRTIIFRRLKQLEDLVSMSVVHWYMGEDGWTFADCEGAIPDHVNGADYLYQVYQAADPEYTGRATVPILWDKKRNTIVNNESADIIRMFNSAFDGVGAAKGDYYPVSLSGEIDSINEYVYENVNNGVYKAGFATTQEAYEEAAEALFDALDKLDTRLGKRRYLTGDRITEADWRLFTTLLRFDPVYFGHFKCNRQRIVDYANLWPYLRDLYQQPGIAETVHMDHIKSHYYTSHPGINPTGIVPVGPDIDFTLPQHRGRMAA